MKTNPPSKIDRIKALFLARLPVGAKPRWYHVQAYRDLSSLENVMAIWPLHYIVVLFWYLNCQWSRYRFQPSWIDKALKTVPPALVIRHSFRNGSRYPCAYVNWRREGSWVGGGWIGEITVWHSPEDRDERTHTVTIGQGCPLGQVSLYFDNIGGYGTWEMAYLDGVDITERDLQWATLWAMLALKSRRKIAAGFGGLREIVI